MTKTSQFNQDRTQGFNVGDRVICNGYPGQIMKQYSEGMAEVRLQSGLVCVSYADLAIENSRGAA